MPESRPLRVAVIGGLSRATHRWEVAARHLGVAVEHHDGRAQGRGARAIASAVQRADVVVVITEPNSHGGVAAARRAAAAAGRPVMLVEHLRPLALPAILSDAAALARARVVAA